jgi:hypothetical protein
MLRNTGNRPPKTHVRFSGLAEDHARSKEKRLRYACLSLIAAAALAAPAAAHHSAAMFDSSKLVVLRGSIISFSYLNPHSWISVQGAPEGTAEAAKRWDVEATSPSSLARIGVQKETLKPGENVTIAIRPLRDGRAGGSMVFFVTPDGKSYGADPKAVGLDVAKLKP